MMLEPNLEKEFYEYVELGRNLPKQAPDKMLIAYGYYKQATVGDNELQRPLNGNNIVKTFMHDQWCRMKGMSKEEAMSKYISYIKGMMKEAGTKIS